MRVSATEVQNGMDGRVKMDLSNKKKNKGVIDLPLCHFRTNL